MTTVLLIIIIAALVFDFVNGWNDSANAVATVISTRVMTPLTAVIFAALLNVAGAMVSTEVAKTIGGGLVDPKLVTEYVLLASMLAASTWVAACTLWGLPISGSHSLIGSLVGAAVAAFGTGVVKTKGLQTVLIALVASPLLGFLVGYLLLVGVYWIAYFMSTRAVRRTFSALQVLSSGFMAFTHGMNDAQKVMGVITLALFSAGQLEAIVVPFWVMVLCALVMGVGTAVGGWKVIRTLGMRLSHLRPIEGFAAETGAGVVLAATAALGVPVSTTHTITGSILGVGSAYRLRSVRWSVGKKIIYAWVLTLPATAVLGGALALGLRALFY
ncbi:MAG: inorganic phosphate transporter [Candidatus Handelsmanbacteria bacterium]|nr:inorganic phosphate transporter [Candidatus Handelsmanbacteria bacterium]